MANEVAQLDANVCTTYDGGRERVQRSEWKYRVHNESISLKKDSL